MSNKVEQLRGKAVLWGRDFGAKRMTDKHEGRDSVNGQHSKRKEKGNESPIPVRLCLNYNDYHTRQTHSYLPIYTNP